MVLVSTSPLKSNRKLFVSILISLTLSVHFCSSALFPQTLESCGIFLQDFHPITSGEQADFIHGLLEHLHLNQTRLTSLILKTNLSQRDIHPIIFRSMKYDCFLHVHINFGKDSLLSTIPSIKNSLKGKVGLGSAVEKS